MKNFFKSLIIQFLFLSSIKAQSTDNKGYFDSSRWATINQEDFFFTADTIKLVKIHMDPYLVSEKTMDVDRYFEGNNYLTLEFSKNKKLILSSTNEMSEYSKKLSGKYCWEFNKLRKILFLYFNDKLLASFILIPHLQRTVEIQGKYMNQAKVKTIEISLCRRK